VIRFGCQTLFQNVIPSVSFFNLGNKARLEIKVWSSLAFCHSSRHVYAPLLVTICQETSRQCSASSVFLVRSCDKLHEWFQNCLQACVLFSNGLHGWVPFTFSVVLLVLGRPELPSSSNDAWLTLKCECHSRTFSESLTKHFKGFGSGFIFKWRLTDFEMWMPLKNILRKPYKAFWGFR
jgi:hypothetical protein